MVGVASKEPRIFQQAATGQARGLRRGRTSSVITDDPASRTLTSSSRCTRMIWLGNWRIKAMGLAKARASWKTGPRCVGLRAARPAFR